MGASSRFSNLRLNIAVSPPVERRCCFTLMTICTTDRAFGNFGLDPDKRHIGAHHGSDLRYLYSSYVIKLKTTNVGLATINARITQQVLSEPLTSGTSNGIVPLPCLCYVVAHILAVVLTHLFSLATNTPALKAVDSCTVDSKFSRWSAN